MNKINQKAIIHAIQEAEKGTTGEIRVHLSRKPIEGDVLALAKAQFEKLAMHKTQARNAVLLYVNLREKKFALYGDQGLHHKLVQGFWENLALEVRTAIHDVDVTQGLVHAVKTIGNALKKHFPGDHPNGNELSDEITET